MADYQTNKNTAPPQGDFSQALRGDIKFSVGAVLQRSWDITLRSLPMMLAAGVVVLLINFFVGTVLEQLLPGGEMIDPDSGEFQLENVSFINLALTNLLQASILAPFIGLLVCIAIRNAADLKTSTANLREVFHFAPQLIAVVVITTVAVMIGAGLLALTHYVIGWVGAITLIALLTLYVQLALTLAVPLVLDRKLSAMRAILGSIMIINKVMGRVLGLFILVYIIVFISALPLGLGLIFTLPMLYNVTGVLYQTLVGYAGDAEQNVVSQDVE